MFYRKIKNIIFLSLLVISSALVLMPLYLVFKTLIVNGITALNLEFFLNEAKAPGEINGGMKHAILGTFYILIIGAFVAVPVGILNGIFLAEYRKEKLCIILKFVIDLLSGAPSIIIGIFAYVLIVVNMKSFSALAGGFALSLIIFPIVARVTEEVLKMSSNSIREAGISLGLTKWQMIYHILMRINKNQIVTGVMLALSRASGETAPLLFTAFGSLYVSYDMFEPMASLPVQIYNYATSPYEDWQRQAWAGALVLILIVFLLNLVVRLLVNRSKFYYRNKKL